MTPVHRLATTSSTNADAMAMAREQACAPLWIVATEQSGGRGRRGRVWHSPPGNLYASLLLIDPCPAEVAPQLGFVAGVALAETASAILTSHSRRSRSEPAGMQIADQVDARSGRRAVGHDRSATVQLKWPNDVLSSDGAKLAGILLEGLKAQDGRFACVVGIGVNCLSHPADLPYAATNISVLAGRDVAPDDLLSSLDERLTAWLAHWKRGRNFAAVRAAWLNHAASLGAPVSAQIGHRTVYGVFETIDSIGRLVIATSDGGIAIDAGDVQFGVPAPTPVPA